MKTPERLRAWRAEIRRPKEERVFYGYEVVGSPGTPVYTRRYPNMDAMLRARQEERESIEQHARWLKEREDRDKQLRKTVIEEMGRARKRSIWATISGR